MRITEVLQKFIRPSATRNLHRLWIKSLFDSAVFFLFFMVIVPAAAGWAFPGIIAVPAIPRYLLAFGCLVSGLALWILCLRAFVTFGGGTPLPMDAPRELVTSGPFAVVRNPLMIAEILVIWGEAFLISRVGMYAYAVLFIIIALAAVRLVEEPELKRRFGLRYEEYCRSVPGWIPKIRKPGGR